MSLDINPAHNVDPFVESPARSSNFDGLRAEVIEAQRVRTDFIKYKLIIVATLAALALGVSSVSSFSIPYVIGLIPLVCLYVDAVCAHNDIRILIIGRFFQESATIYSDYEELCHKHRDMFKIERMVLFVASYFIDLGLLVAGVVVSRLTDPDWIFVAILAGSGFVGLVGTFIVEHLLARNARLIATSTWPRKA